jgi:hypothetical protein
MPAEFTDALKQTYTFNLNFFGTEIGTTAMYLALSFSVVLFFGVNLLVSYIRKKKMN